MKNNKDFIQLEKAYTIIHIPDFEKAKVFAPYCDWCICQSEFDYETYTLNGETFYFCLKEGFEKTVKCAGNNYPYDDYGVSMLAISVDPDGQLANCTNRWNVDRIGNPNLTVQEVSQIVGRDFYDVFKPLKDSTKPSPRQHIVFLTGAGVSAESGLETFRGEDGMWTDQERVRLASAGAFYYDTEKCLDFYNALRMRIAEAEPNEAHRLMAALEKDYEVTVITQNVDNLHERAGSTRVIHLHGELSKVCSSDNRTTCIKEYPLDAPIRIGDKAEDGSQLRPSVVMFGEYVISTDEAVSCIREADLFVVVGTSLKIHPAAGLIRYDRPEIPKFVIDPAEIDPCVQLGFTHFKTTASEGMRRLVETLRATSLRGSDNSCY
jgi:NAD-dependent deacetylase